MMWTRNGFAIAIVVAAAMLCSAAGARAADPEEAHYNVIVGLYNAGKWQQAIQQIEKREKEDANLSEAFRAKYLYAKGLAYEKGEKPAEARAAYEQLVTKYATAPEAQPARIAAVYLDYAAGKFERVATEYPKLDAAKLSEADKKNLALIYAEALYGKKDDAAALAAYKSAVALGADAAAVAPKLFDLHVRLAQHAEVIAHSEKGVPNVPADTLALVRSESFLALSKFAEAEAEARKVADTSALFPRASFVLAQSLIKQNKLKDAAAPLEIAVAKLKDPPAPPVAHLALAECLIESGRAGEVDKALARAEKSAASLPEAEKLKLRGQIAVLRVRAASAGGSDKKKLIEAITKSRESLPPDQVGKLLYMRLFALSEIGDAARVLATMKEDYPVLQRGEEDGPATLVYATALKQAGRHDDAAKLLEAFIERKPQSPDVPRARLSLATAALAKGEHAKAKQLLDAIAAAPQAQEKLGKNAWDEVQFNRGVVAHKLGDAAEAIKALTALLAGNPAPEIAKQALPLLGQAYAQQKDYANAAAAWKQALAGAKPGEEADLRDRLARVLYAAKDHAGAIEQFAAEAKLLGGETKLSPQSREIWARALFDATKFEESGAMYRGLASSFRDSPAYWFEAAVAYERAGKLDEAKKSYADAAKSKAKLPADYAKALDARLAALQLAGGEEQLAGAHYADAAIEANDDAVFDAAVAALRKISAAGKLDRTSREKLQDVVEKLAPEQPRRYMLGAIVLQSLAGSKEADKTMAELADKLAADLTVNAGKIDAKSSGATLGAAMIHFYRGESKRLAGDPVEALVCYETVLSVYPYNEWPDAAACGAAECYAALGDRDTALERFREVASANTSDPGAAKWRDLATKRAAELERETKEAKGS